MLIFSAVFEVQYEFKNTNICDKIHNIAIKLHPNNLNLIDTNVYGNILYHNHFKNQYMFSSVYQQSYHKLFIICLYNNNLNLYNAF